ncbi:x96 protein [Aggregatibacter aphrophilus]|uniref:X96 protein n=1 Tax=Aggregatibacter aphrophilus TaxID=732 RepID=A0A336N438_AGGAP|nr:x96 protein [Aggregatibacter aphrophilus]
MGEKLVDLTKTQLDKIPLEDTLLEAINLAQRLQKEARRRQLQYIGKLLRSMDVEPIQEALDKLENKHQQQQAMLHKLELLRDELIEQGDNALTKFLTDYPQGDRQQLRNLIRVAKKEKSKINPRKPIEKFFNI